MKKSSLLLGFLFGVFAATVTNTQSVAATIPTRVEVVAPLTMEMPKDAEPVETIRLSATKRKDELQ